MSIQRFEGATAPTENGRYVLYVDHIKEVNRASETYYQQYVDALWEASYLGEKIYYLEKEISALKGES